MMKISWTHHGPPRSTSIPVPPGPSLIDWYVMDWDEARGQIVYACRCDDDDRGAELHAFDGEAWSKISKRRFRMDENLEGGGHDSARKGFVAWSFKHDYEKGRPCVEGVLVTDAGAKKLAMRGDDPIVEDPDAEIEVGTFDKSGIFAFDRAREVWVCVTRCGVWELDTDGTWSKKAPAGSIPSEWHSESGEGAWDPVGKRTVFVVQGRENKYAHLVLAWDGETLRSLPMRGLPALTIGLFDSIVQVTGHPRHGIVLHTGGGRLFAPGPTGWTALAGGEDPPPNMEKACLAYDPERDLLVLGPGKHEGAGGSERNQVFFVLRDGRWERQGTPIVYSPIAGAAYGNVRVAHAGGSWYALGSHSLRTWKWTGDAWEEIVDQKHGEKLGGWEILQLVEARGRLHAVMQTGAVFALDGHQWKAIAKQSPTFKKRTGFALAADPDGRLVVWGGEANGRKLNDTLFLEGGKWRAAKKTSPQPTDFKHGKKDSVWVGTAAIWDSALGAVVRFGYEEVAVLGPDDTWKTYKPTGYKESIGARLYEHVPVHDGDTGETLVIDLAGAEAWGEPKRSPQVVRFDLARCEPLATIGYPKELAPKKQHDAPAYQALAESFSYDPTTRALYAQNKEDSTGTYRLDLAELFTKAKRAGARTLPTTGTSRPTERFYRVKRGALEVSPTAKAGFLRARDLDVASLFELVGVESHRIVVGKSAKGSPASRLGGLPSGVTSKTWPRAHRRPMGFLFQVETGGLLKKHAGVAVFCALDGEATNEEGDNAVVLLKAADLKKTCPAPEGVPVLPVRALDIQGPGFEIDEDRALSLAQKDADLGAAFERLQGTKDAQEHGLCDKLGGIPEFLQDVVPVKGHRLVAQLDFDRIATSKTWPDAGLAGCIYVFVRDDEKSGFAFWQYT